MKQNETERNNQKSYQQDEPKRNKSQQENRKQNETAKESAPKTFPTNEHDVNIARAQSEIEKIRIELQHELSLSVLSAEVKRNKFNKITDTSKNVLFGAFATGAYVFTVTAKYSAEKNRSSMFNE